MSYKLAGVVWNDDGTMETKKLSPLEVWKGIQWALKDVGYGAKEIIENALKNYQDLQNKCDVLETEYLDQQRRMLKYDEVKQIKLKALKIIEEKNVDIGGIKNCVGAYAYNDFKQFSETKLVKRKAITQGEFEEIREAIL